MTGDAVRMESVRRTFGRGPTAVHALRGISLTVPRGQLVAVRGRSGSGKTTMLNIIAGLDRPSSGRVWVRGLEVTAMDQSAVLRMRREVVSLVFQSFALLPMLSAAENVGVPMRLVRAPARERDRRVEALLGLVGLAGRGHQRPQELSGGEQQRVAIARALAGGAEVLLADEPTGQLDSRTAAGIMALLRSITHGQGVTTVVATHDQALIGIADRTVEVRDGLLHGQDTAESLA